VVHARTFCGDRGLEGRQDEAKRSNVHTVPHGDGWGNMREGGKRIFKLASRPDGDASWFLPEATSP
jgi:hypothetical protein